MVRITIDSIECQIDDSLDVTLSYSSDDLVELDNGRTGQTLKFKLPITPQNSEIFGAAGDVHTPSKFNMEWHEMIVESDGITLMSGTAYLMQVVWEQSERYYWVECRGGVVSWISTASTTLFKEIGISFSSTLTEDNIKATWSNDSHVKFFPIVRDSYTSQGSTTDVTGLRVLRSIDDYHPFIRISALLTAIIKAEGYTLESQTALDELFDELYISGSYSSAENSAARSAMGFYVKRGESTTTTTDYSGRVSLSPYDIYSSVGNLVDIETTLSDSECYNYGNVLQIDGQALTFVPLTSICMGFEYFLHYTCECQIESRTKLKGIDTLNTIDNGYIKWEITNRYIDQRDQAAVGILYKVMIFDFQEGEIYKLVGVDDSQGVTDIALIESRFTEILIDKSYAYLSLEKFEQVGFTEAEEDWALYFGYIEETSLTEVEITVRSAPTDYSPTSPMEFEFQMLEGGCSSAAFTLYKDTSIRPYFSEYPGYNSDIVFEDIARLSYSALEFLDSLQHLFNLRFSTNEDAKTVRVESFDEFYNSGSFDWSSKLMLSEEVEFVDWAHSTHRSTTYGYQQTDGVVQRMGQSDNLYFGEWTTEVNSYAATSTSQTLLNGILSASTNDEDGVLVVGDRDDITTVDSLEFSPRIVRYIGMIDIEGENYSLPYVSFHAPEVGFTLCFEDRDGAQGLNRHYLNQMELYRRSQLVSLSLQLSTLEYSNLFSPNDSSPSVRSIFLFDIYGERFKTILHSIESYNIKSGVARCTFLTID